MKFAPSAVTALLEDVVGGASDQADGNRQLRETKPNYEWRPISVVPIHEDHRLETTNTYVYNVHEYCR